EGGAELDHVLAALLAAPAEAPSRAEHEGFLRARGLSIGLVAWLSMNLVLEHGVHRWRIDRDALARLLAKTRTEDLWPVVEASGGAIALVRGGRSTFVTDADEARMRAAGRIVETIEGAGHFLHVDEPQAVLDALVRLSQP
ncbi:alpha/beta hydrolase, partial [Myxococcota bacterium]|nr:alpha/beta hydrolase [Myxococcota bacterium]